MRDSREKPGIPCMGNRMKRDNNAIQSTQYHSRQASTSRNKKRMSMHLKAKGKRYQEKI